jgi:hypothetical protein
VASGKGGRGIRQAGATAHSLRQGCLEGPATDIDQGPASLSLIVEDLISIRVHETSEGVLVEEHVSSPNLYLYIRRH